MLTQEYLKNLDCGIRYATYDQTILEYPELKPILDSLPENYDDFLFDVKVHMLMPNQWPCIPNWHCDHRPRKPDLSVDLSIKTYNPNKNMYLYLSNEPFTEFRDGRKVIAGEWVRFNQDDEHRGTMSKKHIWRLFIRASHKDIVPEHAKYFKPKHSQVYLDSNNFIW